MPEKELKIEELRKAADSTEQTILSRNIYYYATLDRLIGYEKTVNRIASETGIAVDQLLVDAGVKTPSQLLETGLQHWDKKLEDMDVPSDEALVKYLNDQFQVKILRVAAILPPDEAMPAGEERGRSSSERAENANRVKLALKTILHSEINGSPIRLDDIEISISAVPPKSSRNKAYWIINIKKAKIAVLIDNQAGNRTFVVTYNSPDELDNLGRKMTLKTKAEKGEAIYHFKYHNEAQFEEDLSNAILLAVEKKGTKKMDEIYFRNAENVRKDLQSFVDDLINKKHKIVKKVEDLSTFSLGKATAVCSNGEEKKGETYLTTAGVQLKIAKDTVEARSKQAEILEALKKIIGIEVVKFPPMNAEYFSNNENVKYDLEAFAGELQKKPENEGKISTIADLNTLNFFNLSVTCKNGESVSGHAYMQRAGIGLGMTVSARESDGRLGEILVTLKRKAGLEVTTLPKMDKKYFSNKENVQHDLEAFVAALKASGKKGVNGLRDLTTFNIKNIEIMASNGELVKGVKYLYRASTELGFNNTEGLRGTPRAGVALSKLLQTAESVATDSETPTPANS